MKFKPHDYQRYCTDYIKEHPVAALFLDMGLGKTAITLTAINDLMLDSFDVSKALVVAPLRVARDTWPAEAEKWDHLKFLSVSVIVGDQKTRIGALQHPALMYVINRETVKWLVEYYEKTGQRWDFDMVVIDEYSDWCKKYNYNAENVKNFKNAMEKRFSIVRRRPKDGGEKTSLIIGCRFCEQELGEDAEEPEVLQGGPSPTLKR